MGETGRNLRVRIGEHKYAIQRGNMSNAIAVKSLRTATEMTCIQIEITLLFLLCIYTHISGVLFRHRKVCLIDVPTFDTPAHVPFFYVYQRRTGAKY